MFPQGLFYILSRKHGFALDVYDGQTKEDANIIVWPQKFEDSDNQLWTFDDGRLVNKKSGHVLDVRKSFFKKDKAIIQCKRKDKNQVQFWQFDQGFICSKEYPSMVFDVKKDRIKGGSHVILYKRKDTDNLNQQWYLEPYQNIESSLHMAKTDVPLHKKEGFGHPQHGYGAQSGVPPELKVLPNDIKVAGVGNNINTHHATPSNTLPSSDTNQQQQQQHSSLPEALLPESGQPSSTVPPQAEPEFVAPPPLQQQQQQQQQTPNNNYYPPPASMQQQQPPPSSSQQQYQQGTGYPPLAPPQGNMTSPGVGGFYVPSQPSQQASPPSYPMPTPK